MSQRPDRQLEQWMEAWHAEPVTPAARPDDIVHYVRSRSRLLAIVLATECLVVAVAVPVVVSLSFRGPLVQRVAMGLLAATASGALAFSWWNWRGVLKASADTMTAFLDLSYLRVRRLQRAVRFGWAVLGAEVAVFVVWIADRLYAGGAPVDRGAEVFAWGLLAAMTALGVAYLFALARWARRERRHVDTLRRELADDHAELA